MAPNDISAIRFPSWWTSCHIQLKPKSRRNFKECYERKRRSSMGRRASLKLVIPDYQQPCTCGREKFKMLAIWFNAIRFSWYQQSKQQIDKLNRTVILHISHTTSLRPKPQLIQPKSKGFCYKRVYLFTITQWEVKKLLNRKFLFFFLLHFFLLGEINGGVKWDQSSLHCHPEFSLEHCCRYLQKRSNQSIGTASRYRAKTDRLIVFPKFARLSVSSITCIVTKYNV